jgi:hypothetical protein
MTKTWFPSPRQLSFYKDLRSQAADLGIDLVEITCADQLPSGHMSALISSAIATIAEARKAARTVVHEAQAVVENARIDHGFHQVTIDGVQVILKVIKPKRNANGRPYAYGVKAQWDRSFWGDDEFEAGRWFYLGRKYNDLLSDATLLDATEAAAFGHANGWCLPCDAKLEDPESVFDGIGPVCYRHITGLTKCQGRKAGEGLRPFTPEVAQAIKERKAAQRANRAAEKRALVEA